MQPSDNILLAALEFDIHQVIRESRYTTAVTLSQTHQPTLALAVTGD